MSRTTHPSILARRPQGGTSGAWWVARWLLVLVVAFDFLSAPFHHHHHDGVEGQLELSTAHVSLETGETHVEADDHLLASHAATAIRIDPSRLAQLPPIDNANAQIALVSVAQLLTAVDELLSRQWRPDRSRPDFRSDRSLPPAGRAPPLHA